MFIHLDEPSRLDRLPSTLVKVVALASLLALAACGQDAPKGDASAAPAAPASPCPPEHTEVADGGFCVKVPADWTMKPPEQRMKNAKQYKWSRKDGGDFIIDLYAEKKMPADVESQIMGKENGTVTKGEIAAGKGKWFLHLKEKEGATKVFVSGKNGLIECGMAGASHERLKAQLERCQTIVPL